MSFLNYIDEAVLVYMYIYIFVCMCIYTYIDAPQAETIAHELKLSLVKYRKGSSGPWDLRLNNKSYGHAVCVPVQWGFLGLFRTV